MRRWPNAAVMSAIVCDAGPALYQHKARLCLLGIDLLLWHVWELGIDDITRRNDTNVMLHAGCAVFTG